MEKRLSKLFAFLAAFAATTTILVCFTALTAPARVLAPSENAAARVEDFMGAVCNGDFGEANAMLLGQSALEESQGFPDPRSAVLWDVYIDSLSCGPIGGGYPTDHGLAWDLTVTRADLPALAQALDARYPEDGDAVTEETLKACLDQLGEEAPAAVTGTLTLELVRNDGQWWILPDNALLDLLTGGGF